METEDRNRVKIATWFLGVPGLLSMGLSANTSYRFLGAALQITEGWERYVLCGVGESGVVGLTLYAWACRSKAPAYIAYLIVLLQSIPAFDISGSWGGVVRVALGPVLLAVVLHLLLKMEMKIKGLQSNSLFARILREGIARFEAFFGIGQRGEDAKAIARSRAEDRAVRLSAHRKAQTSGRIKGKMVRAIDAAQHGLTIEDAAQTEARIVGRIVQLKSAGSLVSLPGDHQWLRSEPVSLPVSQLNEPVSHPVPSEPVQDEPVSRFEKVAHSDSEPVSHWLPVSRSEPVFPGINNVRRPGDEPVSLREPSQVNGGGSREPVRSEPVAAKVAQSFPVSRNEPPVSEPISEPVSHQVSQLTEPVGELASPLVPSEPVSHLVDPAHRKDKASRVAHLTKRLDKKELLTGSVVEEQYGISRATAKRDLKDARVEAAKLQGTGMYP